MTSCVTSCQVKASHRWWVCNKLHHPVISPEQGASKIVKISQQIAKLWRKIKWLVFFWDTVYSSDSKHWRHKLWRDYTTDCTNNNGGDKSKTYYLQLDGERGVLCITIHSNNTWIVFANLGKCRSICHPRGYLYAKTYHISNFSFRSVLWVDKECLKLKNKIKIQLMVHHQLLILLCRQAIKGELNPKIKLDLTIPFVP